MTVQAEIGLQGGNALRMVGVVVGHQNVGQPPAFMRKRGKYRTCVRRVD